MQQIIERMKEQIIKYITNELISSENTVISSDEDLLSSGVLDSLSTMKLISYIEESFEVKVAPEDMVIENFLDVNSMEAFILNKKANPA